MQSMTGLDVDAEAYQTSKRLLKLTCQHQSNPVTPSDCIMSLIGEPVLIHPWSSLDPFLAPLTSMTYSQCVLCDHGWNIS